MNEILLTTPLRRNVGWGAGPDQEMTKDIKLFKTFRPEEEYLDSLYDELEIYWNGLIEVIPDLRNSPPTMRLHDLEEKDDQNDLSDHLLF